MCYTGSGGIDLYSMARPGDCDHQLVHSERSLRVGIGSVAVEEPGDVGFRERCSRIEVVEDDAEVEGPAACGGDDAA